MNLIPLSRLAGACKDQLAIVTREWPNGIPVTQASLDRAVALKLDIDWAAKTLLTATALVEYERVKAPAWAKYERVTDTYQRAKVTILLQLLLTTPSAVR